MSSVSIRSAGFVAAMLLGTLFGFSNAHAVEGGGSNYLLGKRGPVAALVPKPGWYLTNDVYFYDAGRDDVEPIGNSLVGDISAQALVDVVQLTWVTEASLLGGRLAFSGVAPLGNVDVEGKVQVQIPGGGTTGAEESDSVTGFGDPAIGAALGWKRRTGDRFRAWSVYSSVFIPIGDYEVGRIANLGRNRWALDVGGAYTMANFKGGREFSSVLGFTINGENEDTDYNSGHEMHLEVIGKQHLPNHFSFGIAGYWNEQLSADTNSGVLGDFKGRVFGVGPELSYQFTQIEGHPVTVDLRWYHEFEAKNRVEGDAVFLTISLPLSITKRPASPQDWVPEEQP